MKYTLLLLFLIVGTTHVQAQKLAKTISTETCKCFKQKLAEKQKFSNNVLMEQCLKISAEKHKLEIEQVEAKGSKEFYKFEKSIMHQLKKCGALKTNPEPAPQNEGGLTVDDSYMFDIEDCKGMHEGVFLYIPEEGSPISGDYYIERRDSIQYEYWGQKGEYIHTRVIWDSECSYHTAHVGTNSEAVKQKLSPGQGVQATIAEVTGDVYGLTLHLPNGQLATVRYRKVPNQPFKYIGK